jgi:hypothetical protein
VAFTFSAAKSVNTGLRSVCPVKIGRKGGATMEVLDKELGDEIVSIGNVIA